MAGISNDSFRQICKKFGVGLVYSEMISDLAIIHNNKKTMDMLNFKDSERPIAIQLFGSEPETLAAAAKIVCAKCNPDIIDINMGCPVGKVCVKKNAGSALMKDPKKIIKIIKAVKKEINVPLTIKIRAG
jgi:tRNA-dihydrouridine synthase